MGFWRSRPISSPLAEFAFPRAVGQLSCRLQAWHSLSLGLQDYAHARQEPQNLGLEWSGMLASQEYRRPVSCQSLPALACKHSYGQAVSLDSRI